MENMSNNVLLAVIEACGEALVNRKAHEEKMMNYINFQDEQREIMCKRIGELEGRDDEKLKKECEAIENGSSDEEDCVPLTACPCGDDCDGRCDNFCGGDCVDTCTPDGADG
jgi:hypothetical protein